MPLSALSWNESMPDIDRIKVRRSFDRGSCRYDDIVVVQKRVIEEMLARLQETAVRACPARILDVGAGTGMLLRSLRRLFPEAFLAGIDLAPGMGSAALGAPARDEKLLYVEGDAECLPFSDASFDLVVSTSAFQWLNTLDAAFAEVFRVLSPGGMFLFSLFGEGTLYELQSSYRRALLAENALDRDRSHRFFKCAEVVEALARNGYCDVSGERSVEKEYYPDVFSLLRALHSIGAGNAVSVPSNGLGGRRLIMQMSAAYQDDFLEKDKIPVTYDVIFGRGVKA